MAKVSRAMLAIQRPKRVGCSCFRIILLFILCHGLHCSASPSFFRPVSQPFIRISKALVMSSQEGNQRPQFSRSELSPPSIESTDPRNDLYVRERNIRDPSTSPSKSTEGQNTIPLCLTRLRDALMTICNGSFYSPPNQKRSFVRGKREVFVFRRVQRAVVKECCEKPCPPESMRKYCYRDKNEPQQIPISAPFSRARDVPGEVIEGKEDGNEIAPSSIPAISESTEQSLFSFIRFLHYLVNHPTPNRKPTVTASGERTEGLAQQRIQDMTDVDQTIESGSSKNPVGIEDDEPTGMNVVAMSERPFQEAFDPTNVASEGSIPPQQSSGDHHHPGHTRNRDEQIMSRNAITSTISPFMIPLGAFRRNFI